MAYGTGAYGAGPYGTTLPTSKVTSAATRPPDYVVLFTDRYCNVVGDPVVCWTSLDITLRFNEPDSGQMVVPAYDWIREQIVPGNRIVVVRDGTVLIAGPIEKWQHERSDNGENSGVGKLTISFADDFALIAAHEMYPDPTQDVEGQAVDNWTFTGNAELALRELVDTQAGENALAPRQIPQLVLGALAGVGGDVTVTADRMQMAGDVARKIAEVGGGLGFRTRQSGNQILFEVYSPPDKSGTVRFGFGLGNLKYISYEVTAPTATSVSVGGQGDGADRYMIERTNPDEMDAWGRFEKHVARPGNGYLPDLQDDGDRALADGAATTRLTTNVSDSPTQRFGEHYNVGDVVAVESWPGEQVADVVRTVHFQVYATSGEYVAATIGNQAALTDPEWVRRVREIDARLDKLDRTVMPAP
jgi:hypothetical protein